MARKDRLAGGRRALQAERRVQATMMAVKNKRFRYALEIMSVNFEVAAKRRKKHNKDFLVIPVVLFAHFCG
jgi:hypothetical protein